MSTTVKIGLIGCGGIARRHVEWFLAKPECEIAALCDISLDAARSCADEIRAKRPECRVRTTQEYRELLATPDLDAVAVLLPHALHYPVTKDALEAGKHVLVEKPMATEAGHARRLMDTARTRGKVIAIGYQRSYLPEYAYVRRMVEAGELGEIQFVSAHLEQAWHSYICSTVAGDSWRKSAKQAGGGQLVDSGSHTVAALLDVTRLVPAEAFAFVERRDLPVDVNTAAVVRFTSGAVAALCIGGFGHSVTEVLRVVGEKRSARIFFRTVHEQSLEIDGAPVDAKAAIPASTPNADLVDAIVEGRDVRANALLGLRVAQLTDALYTSAAEHRPCSIDAE